jgi:hypothetical protein
MLSLGDYNLVGVPQNYGVTVNSGAGGNTTAALVVPAGRIWVVKYLVAYHDDGGANRTLVYMFLDPIRVTNIQGPFLSVAANIRYELPNTTVIQGPLVVTPGCFNVSVIAQALAANKNVTLEAHVHCFYGVPPLG